MKVDVLVEIYQGVIQGVRVLPHEEAAVEWWKWAAEHGYKDYEDFLEAVRDEGPDEELRWFTEIDFNP